MDKEDKKSDAVSFCKELELFRESVIQLHQNGGLSKKREFLKKVAGEVERLYSSAKEMQQEQALEEVGSIIQNIFVQPLSRSHQVSILKAAHAFKNGVECDLLEVMGEYVKCPASTKSFIRELELLFHAVEETLDNVVSSA